VTIRNFFLGGDFAVDRVEFASGGLISADQFFGIFGATNPDPIDSPAFENLPDEGFFGTVFVGDASDQIIIGSSDADFINAGSGNDDISGGANADYLIGGRGIDTFRFGFGDGIDTLNLFDGSNIAQDILQFEEGITLSNLGAERVGDNLRLVLTGGQDQIFVRDYFNTSGANFALASILFSDGSSLSESQLQVLVDAGIQLNVGPAAVSDSVVGREDETLVIDVAELLVNDSDGNGDVLSITAVSNALNGSVTLDSVAQTISFVPDANYNGAASFDYTVSDGTLESVASVAIDIAAVNDAPAAVADSATVEQDTAITLNVADVLLNDRDIEGDALTITAVANALNGTVVLDSVAETITFTPDADYFGPASFDYTVSDGQASDTGTVNLTVNEEVVPGPGSISVSVDTTSATNVEAANFDLSVLSGGATVSYAINGGAGGFSQDGAGVDGGASELLNAGESLRISFDPQVSPNGIDNVVLTLSDFESGNADAVTLTVTHDSDNEGTSQLSVVQVFAQDANSSEQIDLSQFSGVTQIDIANASGFEVGLLNVSYEEPVPGQAGVNSFEASATISGDILIGSQGNDQLEGGDGNDELFFAAGDGQDTIDAQDDPVLVDSQETLRLEGITQDELWFSRTGDNLLIDVIGNDDQVTVNNDFLSEEFQINTLVTGDSVVSNGQIDQLVAAMSVFHIQDGGSEVSSLSVQDEQQPMIAVGS